LQGPDGPLYTRDGVFRRGSDGALLSEGGLPVLGDTGPLTVPAGAKDVAVGRDGSVRADGAPVGTVRLARFDDTSRLTPAGTTLFRAPPGAERRDGAGNVLQGYREASNVQPAAELVALIRA